MQFLRAAGQIGDGLKELWNQKDPKEKDPGEDKADTRILTCVQRKEVVNHKLSKIAFVANPKVTAPSEADPDMPNGLFFEFKVEDCYSGFIPSLAMGFTTTDVKSKDFKMPRELLQLLGLSSIIHFARQLYFLS